MKVEWYVIDRWEIVSGPYKTKREALESVESDWRSGDHRVSEDEYLKTNTIFPQLVKES